MSDSKRVLITGINGFTGKYLETLLSQAGHQVFGLTHENSAEPHHYRADLTSLPDIMEVVHTLKVDWVVHLAAIAFVAHSDVEAMYRVNLIGTRNLLQALAQSGHRPESVLIASSANIYGNIESDGIDELQAPAPANDYAVSKLAMEHMARLWQDKLPITIVRPFNYTGIGQAPVFLLPKIVDHFRRRDAVIELGNIDVERDFSDVRDVVQCYAKLLDARYAGATFNVCSQQARSIQQVLDLCTQITGHQIEVKVNPAFVRTNDVKRLIGNRGRLNSAIGDFQRIPFESTLAWMLEEAL